MSFWTTIGGFTDPPPPPEGHTLEVQRDPFLGFITHYRHTENAMQEKIGADHIGHVSITGAEEERKAMLRVMGSGVAKISAGVNICSDKTSHGDDLATTQEVERLMDAQAHFIAMTAEQTDETDRILAALTTAQKEGGK